MYRRCRPGADDDSCEPGRGWDGVEPGPVMAIRPGRHRTDESGGAREMDATDLGDRSFAAAGRLLEGKVAIITGASRGIGATAAKVFAEAGATVVLAARGEEPLASVAADIERSGGRALAVPTDVADARAVDDLVRTTVDAFGRLDAAFNNAGGSAMPVPLANQTPEDFDRVVDVNLRGIFLCMRYEIPAMLASGGGAIVNMSSTAGIEGWQGIGAYVAAKHGVVGLTKSSALDYADRGVRINAVAPGSIMTERIRALSDEQREPILQSVLMH